MNIKIIEIAGEKYELDIDLAITTKSIQKANPLRSHTFSPGDVFIHPAGATVTLLLVQVIYGRDNYQLLGLGCCPNSNNFYHKTHSLDEIKEYLIEKGMVFKKNVNEKLLNLIRN